MAARPMRTFRVLPMRQHFVALKAICECQIVYATYKGSVRLCYPAHVVPTGAGTHAAPTLIVVGAIFLSQTKA